MGFEQQPIKIYPYTHAMSRRFGDAGVFNHALPGIPPLRPYFWDSPLPIKGCLFELVRELGYDARAEHASPLQGFIPAQACKIPQVPAEEIQSRSKQDRAQFGDGIFLFHAAGIQIVQLLLVRP